jgi:two-component system sensor histidine kinase/response regulator
MNAKSQTPASSGTIAIVDDEPENLNVLEASLSNAGYRVAVFPRGELALAAAQDEQPDLILLDIRMPGMDGYEVCRRFKADEHLRAIPILFISALSSQEDLSAGFECGGVDYITKPFHENEVLARVSTHIALKKAYDQLAGQHARLGALEHQRDSYVHMLVHDMRNPLFGIYGYLTMLETDCRENLPAPGLEKLRIAIRGTRLLSRMISNVIDVSRMETGTIPLHNQQISIQTLFQAAMEQAQDPLTPHPFTEHVDPSCPPLFCDPVLNARILANLLANAIKHAPPGSEIAFGAEHAPPFVRLWVRDKGPGIPSHVHKTIFEKFKTLENPSLRPTYSTGLGLAFCKLAVAAQGCSIGLTNNPGGGSTFWFTLPAMGNTIATA